MTTVTITEQELKLSDDTDDPDQVAHFVDQRPVEQGGKGQDIAIAMILGIEVEALCGYRWVPYRDPTGKPVCKSCIDAYGQAR